MKKKIIRHISIIRGELHLENYLIFNENYVFTKVLTKNFNNYLLLLSILQTLVLM